MFDLLIKNAKIVTENEVKLGCVGIENGCIIAILDSGDDNLEAKSCIDIQGKYLLPGGIDDHVHFNEPGYTWREDFAHGSRAAAKGGITTVIDMPMQNRPPVTNVKVFQDKEALLEGKSLIDYCFWGALVRYNADDLKALDAEGAVAYKSFMCDPGNDYTNLFPEEIEERLNILKEFDGLAGFHCENYAMIKENQEKAISEGRVSRKDYLTARPVEAELKAVEDIVNIVAKTKGKAHICHVSHPLVAQCIKEAKANGLQITAETCMHYLLFTENDLIEKGMAFKCSPPLRAPKDAEKLWDYVEDGTLDCICSDHSPARIDEKSEDENGAFGAWGGISSVQTSLQGLWDYVVNKKQLSPTIIAKVLAANPAKIFGIYGKKGAIKQGFDADLVVLDENINWEITADCLEYKNKFSAFCGQKGQGLPVMTIVRGNIVYDNGKFSDEYAGKLIKKIKN